MKFFVQNIHLSMPFMVFLNMLFCFSLNAAGTPTPGWRDVDADYLVKLLSSRSDPIGVEITSLEQMMSQLTSLEKSRKGRGDDTYTAEQKKLVATIIKTKNSLLNKMSDLQDGSLTLMATNLPQEQAVELVTNKIILLNRRISANALVQNIAKTIERGDEMHDTDVVDFVKTATTPKKFLVKRKQGAKKAKKQVTITIGDQQIERDVAEDQVGAFKQHIVNAADEFVQQEQQEN